MKKALLFTVFVIVVLTFISCGGAGGGNNLLPESELTYDKISQKGFSSGGIAAGSGSFNQMKKDMIIYILTSGRKYGYLKILDFETDFTFEKVIFDDEGNELIRENGKVFLNGKADLDMDGIDDMEWTTTQRMIGRNTSARFARLNDMQYLQFLYDDTEDIGALYALEGKTTEMEQSGITYIYPEEGKIVGVSTNYEESDAVPTTDSQIAYVKTENFPEYRTGDVIIDYENLKLRKLSSDPVDEGNYILMQTEEGNFDDVFNKFEFNGQTSVSELEVVEEEGKEVKITKRGIGDVLEFKVTVGPDFMGSLFGQEVQAGASGEAEIACKFKGGIQTDFRFGKNEQNKKVEIYFDGENTISMKSDLMLKLKYSGEKSISIAKFQTVVVTGPVFTVLSLDCKYKTGLSIDGEFGKEINAYTNTSTFKAGFRLSSKEGWEFIGSNDQNTHNGEEKLILQGEIGYKNAIVFSLAANIYGFAGPKVELENYVKDSFSAQYQENNPRNILLDTEFEYRKNNATELSVQVGLADWMEKCFNKTVSLGLGTLTLYDLTLSRVTWSIPKSPSNLTAENSNGNILLNWQDNSTKETGYEVWRKEGNGDYRLITTRDENVNAYMDEAIDMNTEYTYKVRAYNEPTASVAIIAVSLNKNYSDYSNSVTFTPNNTNENPTVSKTSGPGSVITQNSATFVWSGSDQSEARTIARYQYQKDYGNWENNYPYTGTSHTWTDIATGTHTFKVKAIDNTGLESDEVTWSFNYGQGATTEGSMTLINAGTFQMGDEYDAGGGDEKPVHNVTLTHDYYMGTYEVTNAEFVQFLNDAGVVFDGDGGEIENRRIIYINNGVYSGIEHNGTSWVLKTQHNDIPLNYAQMPVVYVTWWGAVEYCNWLSGRDGVAPAYVWDETINTYRLTDYPNNSGYRLPTEAEWEYAARGGQNYKYAGTADELLLENYAWYWSNSDIEDGTGHHAQVVGQKLANGYGLYDMSGNVWEWSSDNWYSYTEEAQVDPYYQRPDNTSSSARVTRGGSWGSIDDYCRVADRDYWSYDGSGYYSYVGFRLARTR